MKWFPRNSPKLNRLPGVARAIREPVCLNLPVVIGYGA